MILCYLSIEQALIRMQKHEHKHKQKQSLVYGTQSLRARNLINTLPRIRGTMRHARDEREEVKAGIQYIYQRFLIKNMGKIHYPGVP